MTEDIAIRLQDVSKTFYVLESGQQSFLNGIYSFLFKKNIREIVSLKNINLEIKKGEFIGIIGANGSGKSTLLNIMTGVYLADKGGKAQINGSFIKLSLGLGFNVQLSALENIYLNASILGLTIDEINQRIEQILEFSELEKFVNTKVKYFSRGMKSRLGFAIAIHADPDILFLDEIFGGVGDEKFKQKSELAFREKLVEGKTIVLASHSLSLLKNNADKVLLLDKGKCLKIGEPDEVIDYYLNSIKPKSKKNKDLKKLSKSKTND